MSERVDWSAAETVPPAAEALKLQGVPEGATPSARTAALLEEAREEYLALAEPRGMFAPLSHESFASVYRGAGRNAPDGPLDTIAPLAERLALFVATLGERITARIRARFDANEPAAAVMLDAVASAAADGLAARIGDRFLASLDDRSSRFRVLPYSPGYCGWHVTGQGALFAHLKPEAIGVTLNASCLMQPLKSVSGVLVAGPGPIHRFAPQWPFCDDCADRPCRARIASVLSA